MITLPNILLAVLGTWGAVWLLIYGDGPAAILARFRHWMGVRYTDTTGERYGDTWIGDLFNCPVCLSVWIAPVVLGLLVWFWPIVAVLAVVGSIRIIVEFVQDD